MTTTTGPDVGQIGPAGAEQVRLAQVASPSPDPGNDALGPLPDPYRAQQWHLDRIGVDGRRELPDGLGQVIAVLDSGVDLAHPDLLDAWVRDDDGEVVGRDFVDGDDVPQDVLGHGTMVAGIAAARAGNGLGVAGVVGPEARLLPVRVLDDEGRASASRVADGVDWAVTHGATILNLSLESAGVSSLRDDPALDAAIERALAEGVVVVVAAGNGDELVDPGGDDGVVVVGATDRTDRRAGFSDRGRTDLVMAPGVGIVSTWCRSGDAAVTACDGRTHSYGVADGTSFAAPQVSALVAMLASTGMTPVEAARRLAATAEDLAVPGPDVMTGRGLVAVDAALGPWPDGAIPPTAPPPPEDPQPATPAPRPETAPAVARATAPGGPTTPTRLVVVVAVLAAVGVVARGLVAVASHRSRLARVPPTGRGEEGGGDSRRVSSSPRLMAPGRRRWRRPRRAGRRGRAR